MLSLLKFNGSTIIELKASDFSVSPIEAIFAASAFPLANKCKKSKSQAGSNANWSCIAYGVNVITFPASAGPVVGPSPAAGRWR